MFLLIKSFFSVCAAVTTLVSAQNKRDQMAFKSFFFVKPHNSSLSFVLVKHVRHGR